MAYLLSDVLGMLAGEPVHWCAGCQQLHLINVNTPNKYSNALWTWNKDPQKPTFNPSINIVGHCHYFIRDGMIQYCGDSKHHLAGQTVPLSLLEEDWPLIPDAQ